MAVFFDATQVAPIQGGGGILPIGEYDVVVISAEVKPTKDNQSGYLQLDLGCISQGPNEGTSGAYRLNIYNQNETAKNIAKGQLSAICHVTGRYQLNSEQDLVNSEFRVRVEPQRDNDEYTEVRAILNFDGTKPKAGQAPSVRQQQAPQQTQQPQAQPQTQNFGAPSFAAETQPQQTQTQPQSGQPAWGGQTQEQPQTGGAPAWGGQPQQTQEQAPAQQPAWGGGGQTAATTQQPAWGGGAPAGDAPAWAKG